MATQDPTEPLTPTKTWQEYGLTEDPLAEFRPGSNTPDEPPGFFDRLGAAVKDSFYNTSANTAFASTAAGLTNEKLPQYVLQRIMEQPSWEDEGAEEVFERFQKEGEDIGAAWNDGTDLGKVKAAAETLDFVGKALWSTITDFGDTSVAMATQAGNLAATYVPAVALGALTEAALPMVPGSGTVGATAGIFSGTSIIEYGATVRQEVMSRVDDPSNMEQVAEVLNDEGVMNEIRRKAKARGLSIAAVDTLTNLLGLGLLKGTRRIGPDGKVVKKGDKDYDQAKLSKTSALGRTAGASTLGMVGGGAGEGVAGLASEGEIDWGEVGVEAGLSGFTTLTDIGAMSTRLARQKGQPPTDTTVTPPAEPVEQAPTPPAEPVEQAPTPTQVPDEAVVDTIVNAPDIDTAVKIAEDVTDRGTAAVEGSIPTTPDTTIEPEVDRLIDEEGDLAAEPEVEYLLPETIVPNKKPYFDSEQEAVEARERKIKGYQGQRQAEMRGYLPVERFPGQWTLARQSPEKVRNAAEKAAVDTQAQKEAAPDVTPQPVVPTTPTSEQQGFVESQKVPRVVDNLGPRAMVPQATTEQEASFVEQGLQGKTLDGAMDWVAQNTQRPERKVVAEKLADKVRQLQDAGMKYDFKIVQPRQKGAGDVPKGASGVSRLLPRTFENSVLLRGAQYKGLAGTSIETTLHESIHAASQYQLEYGRKNPNTPEAKFVKDMDDLRESTTDYITQNPDVLKGTAYENDAQANERLRIALGDADEFLAWGMTNLDFQEVLKKVPYKGRITAWNRFTIIMRNALGMARDDDSALSALFQQFGDLIEVDAPAGPLTKKQPAKKADTQAQPETTPTPKKAAPSKKAVEPKQPEPEQASLFEDQAVKKPTANPDITPKSGSYENRDAAFRALRQKKKNAEGAELDRLRGYKPVETEGGWVLRYDDKKVKESRVKTGDTNLQQRESEVVLSNEKETINTVLEQATSAFGIKGRSPSIVEQKFAEAGYYRTEPVRKNIFLQDTDYEVTPEEGRAEQGKLVKTAKDNGFFFKQDDPALDILTINELKSGEEHFAYIVQGQDSDIVVRNTKYGEFGHGSKYSPAKYLKRLEDYNKTFPTHPIHMIGVTEMADGSVSILTTQPFVPGVEFATMAELDASMRKNGWYPVTGSKAQYRHQETGMIIADVHPGNVLHRDGDLYFIDVAVEKLPNTVESTQASEVVLDETGLTDIKQQVNQVPNDIIENYSTTTSYTYPEQAKLQELRDAETKTTLDNRTESEHEAARSKWRATNAVDVPKGAIPEARKAAEDYYYEELSWDEFTEILDLVDPIVPLSDIPDVPSFEDMYYGLNKNQVSDKSGIIGYNHPGIEEGTKVGVRLDIPLYERFGRHVATVTGKDTPRKTQYARTAVLNNVDMKVNPDQALDIAKGWKEKGAQRNPVSKSPMAVMNGEWVNEDSGTTRARMQDWFGEPGVVQIGYNPRRRGQFYDKATGMPVIGADKILQVGNLVLGKGVKYGDPMSPELMATSASGESIRFQETILEEGSNSDPGIPIKESTPWRRFIESFNNKVVDSYFTVRKVQEAIESTGVKLADALNIDQALTLFPGETRESVNDFINTWQEPLANIVRESGLSWSEAAKFLHARHAKEANAVLAARNPDSENKDRLSGMSNSEADKILASYADNEKVQRIGQFNDLMAKEYVEQSVKSGLMSKDEAAAWRTNYKHYVPLNRVDVDSVGGVSRGQGFDVRGKSSKLRTGSLREVDYDNMFAHIMQSHITRIIRNQKNEVTKTLWNMANANPDSTLWETDINKFPQDVKTLLQESRLLRRLWAGVDESNPDALSGLSMAEFKVELRNMLANNTITNKESVERLSGKNRVADALSALMSTDPNTPLNSRNPEVFVEALENLTKGGTISSSTSLNELNILSHKVDGENRYLWLNDRNEVGKKVARAMRNMDKEPPSKITEAFAKFTRLLSSLITTYSPEFMLTNPIRDIQTALYNMTDTQIDGFQKDVIKNLKGAAMGIREAVRGEADSEWAATFEEFRRAGGMVGWMDAHKEAAEYMKVLQKDLEGFKVGGKRVPGQDVVKRTMEFMQDYNTVFENAVRLSAYKVARDNGLTQKQAAKIAKQLTVDFNQKGELGTTINAFYMFFNASVQGSARLLKASLDPRNKRLRKFMTYTIAGAALTDMMNRLLSDDEDEYNQMVERHGARSWLVKDLFGLTDDGYFKFPLPYGYNLLSIMGQEISAAASYAMGNNQTYAPLWAGGNIVETMQRMFSSRLFVGSLESFNPVNSGSFMEMLAPTILDPSARIATNREWHGGPLYPDYSPTAPNYTKYYGGAREVSKDFTKWLYDNTHDMNTLKGGIDWSPEWVDMYVDFIAGGAGKFMADAGSLAFDLSRGDDPELKNIPLARRFYTGVGPGEKKTAFYDKVFEITTMDTELNRIRDSRTKEEYDAIRSQIDPERIKLIGVAKAARRDTTRLKKAIRAAEKRGDDKRAEVLEERMVQRMIRFSKEYNKRLYGVEY